MTILTNVLAHAPLRSTQRRFLQILLSLWLALPGRVNAANLARYSGMNEKTFRNWLHRRWPWASLNLSLIRQLLEQGLLTGQFILVIDASFVPKSGHATSGLGSFWNSCASRA